MLKKMNKKGFTLAELLIVVAIIAVLVAISIPIFSAQLEKAKEATDMANIRSAYAEVIADYLGDSTKDYKISVPRKSNNKDWNSGDDAKLGGVKYEDLINTGEKTSIDVVCSKDGKVTINGLTVQTSSVSGS